MIRCRSQIKLHHTSWSPHAAGRVPDSVLATAVYQEEHMLPRPSNLHAVTGVDSSGPFPFPCLAWPGLSCLQMKSLSFLCWTRISRTGKPTGHWVSQSVTGVLAHTLWLEVEEGGRTERTHTAQAPALAETLQRR